MSKILDIVYLLKNGIRTRHLSEQSGEVEAVLVATWYSREEAEKMGLVGWDVEWEEGDE